MALLFAEDGVRVSLSDPAEKTMDAVVEKAERAGYTGRISKFTGTPKTVCDPAVRYADSWKTTNRFANLFRLLV